MTYEELKINLDLYDTIDVLKNVGRKWNSEWFMVCDEGDCHLFKGDGTEDDIGKVDSISMDLIPLGIKKIVIPDSVTSISCGTFWGYRELTSVTIPDSVMNIGSYAFIGCSGMKSVTIKANGGNALNVKQMMIKACVSENIKWNLPG